MKKVYGWIIASVVIGVVVTLAVLGIVSTQEMAESAMRSNPEAFHLEP